MKKTSGSIERTVLPKIKAMLSRGVVKAGDVLIAKGTDEESTLLANDHVSINDEEMSMQDWLKRITGWKSVETYKFAIHKDTGKVYPRFEKNIWKIWSSRNLLNSNLPIYHSHCEVEKLSDFHYY